MLVHPDNRAARRRAASSRRWCGCTSGRSTRRRATSSSTPRSMVRVQVDARRTQARPRRRWSTSRRRDARAERHRARRASPATAPLYFDAYAHNRATGAFILVDSLDQQHRRRGHDPRVQRATLDTEPRRSAQGSARGLGPHAQDRRSARASGASASARAARTVWLTGLPGSGRWALAYALERKLFDLGPHRARGRRRSARPRLDDQRRARLHQRRADHDLRVSCVQEERSRARCATRSARERFFEVFVDTALEVCRERRPDADFSGLRKPAGAAAMVHLDRIRMHDAVDRLLGALKRAGQFEEI